MARIFLSHSSKDKAFVLQLAKDLSAVGHVPWVDEWEIKVGECIVTKVAQGLDGADCVVLVLTPHAVASGWVEREWKAKYWVEIEQKKLFVLPALVEACEVPSLLKTRKYANFAKSYAIGFHELANGIGLPIVKTSSEVSPSDLGPSASEAVASLLAKIHAKDITLAACFAEAIQVAVARQDDQLRTFAEGELGGWHGTSLKESDPEFPRYRLVRTFYSATAQLNMEYFGWNGDGRNMIRMMEEDRKNFSQAKTFMPQPISEVEGLAAHDGSKGVLQWTRQASELVKAPKRTDVPVWFYAPGNAFREILQGARSELTRKLLTCLPNAALPR